MALFHWLMLAGLLMLAFLSWLALVLVLLLRALWCWLQGRTLISKGEAGDVDAAAFIAGESLATGNLWSLLLTPFIVVAGRRWMRRRDARRLAEARARGGWWRMSGPGGTLDGKL